MKFSHEAIFGGFRLLKSKGGKDFIFVTLLIDGLGSVDMFCPASLGSVLSTLEFGSRYDFDFIVKLVKGNLSITLEGVH